MNLITQIIGKTDQSDIKLLYSIEKLFCIRGYLVHSAKKSFQYDLPVPVLSNKISVMCKSAAIVQCDLSKRGYKCFFMFIFSIML